MLISDMLCG